MRERRPPGLCLGADSNDDGSTYRVMALLEEEAVEEAVTKRRCMEISMGIRTMWMESEISTRNNKRKTIHRSSGMDRWRMQGMGKQGTHRCGSCSSRKVTTTNNRVCRANMGPKIKTDKSRGTRDHPSN